MKVRSLLASAAVAAAIGAPVVAGATTETLEFSGLGQFGPIGGRMVLDVVGGVAVGGTGSISGAGIPGAETMTLITPSTPGSSGYPYGIGWRDGNGTDTWGWDNLVPIDYVGGLDFSFGAGTSPPSWGHGWQFGIWNNNGPVGLGSNYQAWMSGPGYGLHNFYGETGALTVSIPEPATWAMVLIGFGGLGLAASGKRRQARTLDA